MRTHESKLVSIPLEGIDFIENTEYFIEFSVTTKSKWGLLSKGFEVAKEQVYLSKKFKTKTVKVDNGWYLKSTDNSNEFILYNNYIKVAFDKMPITHLLDKQELKIIATAKLGFGKTHIKHAPCAVFFSNKPILKINNNSKKFSEGTDI